MADSKISDLAVNDTLTGTESFVIDQGLTTVKLSLDDLKQYTNVGVLSEYTITFNFSSVPSIIPIGTECISVVPKNGTISKAVIHGQGNSGSAEIDILIASTPMDIPSAVSITATENLELISDYGIVSTIPVAWTEIINENDFIIAKIISTDLTQLTLILTITI
mgnify:CR=1 FL=1|jgi:hypothetical protein